MKTNKYATKKHKKAYRQNTFNVAKMKDKNTKTIIEQ